MRLASRTHIIALALIAAFGGIEDASPQAKVDGFFNPDTVTGQRVDPRPMQQRASPPRPQDDPARPTAVPTSPVGDFFGGSIDGAGFTSPGEATAPPDPRATEVPGALATATARNVYGTPGAPVFFVDALINGMDREHMYRQLTELSHVVFKQKVPLGAVNLIGSEFELEEAEVQELTTKLGFPPGVWRATIPSAYRITRSPTWILQTREGKVVLEGIEGLREYFNKNGEFVDVRQTTPLRKVTGSDDATGPKQIGVE